MAKMLKIGSLLRRRQRIFLKRFFVSAATMFFLYAVFSSDVFTMSCCDDPCAESDKFVHVAIMADKRLFEPVLTLATSIYVNTLSDVMFHFVTLIPQVPQLEGMLENSTFKFPYYEVIGFDEEKIRGRYKVRSSRKELYSPMNFARFYLPELLPSVCRVIYLDPDILVLGDISELYNVRIREKDVVAALNESHYSRKRRWSDMVLLLDNPYVKARGILPHTLDMINTGVLVADLDKWRERDITKRIEYWMQLNIRLPVVRFGDYAPGSQVILMMTIFDKFTPLRKDWNMLFRHMGSKIDNQKLLHWNGSLKPWMNDSRNENDIFVLKWREYRDLSQFNKIPGQQPPTKH